LNFTAEGEWRDLGSYSCDFGSSALLEFDAVDAMPEREHCIEMVMDLGEVVPFGLVLTETTEDTGFMENLKRVMSW